MALVALDGTPLVRVGMPNRAGSVQTTLLGGTAIDAVNEAAIMVGHIITADGASHIIDATGSSSLQWRSGTATFASASTTVKVGLAAVLTTAGPPARAVNVADVITFDVSRSIIGGSGGITSTAWQTHTPDSGSKTIANGDLVAFCVQMTARGGTDSIVAQAAVSPTQTGRPSVTSFAGGTYLNTQRLPNVMIVFNDGVRGWFWGSWTNSTGSVGTTWNSGSATKEYGNLLQFPFPVRAYGITVACSVSGDTDLVFYSNPTGTPVAEKTVSIDVNTVGVGSDAHVDALFPSPYDLAANTPYAVIVKPGGTDVSMNYVSFNSSADQVTVDVGTNGYAVNRASGAFASQNANKDRYAIGLIVGAFDAGGGGGRAVQVNNDSLVA